MPRFEIVQVDSSSRLAEVRGLVAEYAQSLGIDLSFQDFDRELAQLEKVYTPPEGCLLLALDAGRPVGCVAVRPLEAGICEMKRLFVRPEARGASLGRRLAEAAIAFGRQAGYRAMRLDTLPSMTAAQALYRSLGFQVIPPYRANPVPGTAFMELRLRDDDQYPDRAGDANVSRWRSLSLAVRSIAWALLLPGLLAGYVPWRYFGLRDVRVSLQNPMHLLALAIIGLGSALLGVCIFEFARSGRGTLAAVDPPRELVVRGLYRYVRNPMYLSVTAIVLGEILLTRSGALLIYWAVWFLAVNLFVLGYEEPTLRRRFGPSYERYIKNVGRWLPRFR